MALQEQEYQNHDNEEFHGEEQNGMEEEHKPSAFTGLRRNDSLDVEAGKLSTTPNHSKVFFFFSLSLYIYTYIKLNSSFIKRLY